MVVINDSKCSLNGSEHSSIWILARRTSNSDLKLSWLLLWGTLTLHWGLHTPSTLVAPNSSLAWKRSICRCCIYLLSSLWALWTQLRLKGECVPKDLFLVRSTQEPVDLIQQSLDATGYHMTLKCLTMSSCHLLSRTVNYNRIHSLAAGWRGIQTLEAGSFLPIHILFNNANHTYCRVETSTHSWCG